MKNIPNIDEIKSFFKSNFKIIILSILSLLFLLLIGITYTIYTDNKINDNAPETIEEVNKLKGIDENIPLEEQLKPEEIELIVESLQKNATAFSFYLEKEPSDAFQATDLIKELLISPAILSDIERETNMKVEPIPEIAVNVDLDPNSLLITVTIGTGDKEMNKVLANAYFTMIAEEKNSFFDNKTVYITSEPEVVNTTILQKNKTTDIIGSGQDGFSFKRVALLTVIVIILGAFMGIFIALARSLWKKEVSELYSFAIKDEDVVLNINTMKIDSESELSKQIVHSIIHPYKKVKLILSESSLEETILTTLKEETTVVFGRNTSLLSDTKDLAVVANSITDIDPKLFIDEIIFVCKKNETSKFWYENQRNLLEVYKATIKVILI